MRAFPGIVALDERQRTAHVASAHDNHADLSGSGSARNAQGGVPSYLTIFPNASLSLADHLYRWSQVSP